MRKSQKENEVKYHTCKFTAKLIILSMLLYGLLALHLQLQRHTREMKCTERNFYPMRLAKWKNSLYLRL